MPEKSLVTFGVGPNHIGLPASCVDQVVFACEISPLPNAPIVVPGVIDFHGTLTPVFDMNARFGLPSRGAQLDNYFIVCDTPRRKVALLVDEILGVVPFEPGGITSSDDVLPGMEYIKGIVRLSDDLILIQDLAKFLSIDEEMALHTAMQERTS